MPVKYAAVVGVELLEPLVIRGSYSRGGHYSSPSFLPSSTIAGAIVSEFFRWTGEGRLDDVTIWPSHGYPCDFKLGDPPPLPTLTMSKLRNGEHISVALELAEAVRRSDPSILIKLEDLDKKVGNVFLGHSDGRLRKCDPPPKEISTHVVLDHRTRAHATIPTQGGELGLLYTQEVILPYEGDRDTKFYSLAFVDSQIYDFLKGGIKVRMGALKGKGYGLTHVKIIESRSIDEYKELRIQSIQRWRGSDGLITVDVLTPTSRNVLSSLGNPVYEKTRLITLKTWLEGRFHLYHGLMAQGSILIYEGNVNVSSLVSIETTPPSNRVRMINGLDMVFFENPVHRISLDLLNSSGER